MGPAADAGSSWPQSYFDAAHSNHNAKEKTLSVANVANLQLKWGSSAPTNGVTAFTLDSGVIYAQGQGANAPNLSAIDASTGATLWTVGTGNDGYFLSGSIAVTGDLVVAGCGFADQGGTNYGAICGYRKSDGKQAWHWSNPCNCLPEAAVYAPLVYDSGSVYFGYSNGGAGANQYVVSLDAKTGAEQWTYVAGGPNTVGEAAVTIGNGFVYFACGGQNNFSGVCALNQSNGGLAWSTEIGTTELGLTAGKNTLYVSDGFDGQYVSLNGSTGAQIWTYACAQCGDNVPVSIAHKVIYAPGYRGMTYALDAANGAVLWSGNLGDTSSVSVANGVLYLDQQGTNAYAAAAYDASNGTLLWNSSIPGSTLNPPPIVDRGILYIANASCGTVCAYSLSGGDRPH
jgi:outer membrane protein assembly factor BamB